MRIKQDCESFVCVKDRPVYLRYNNVINPKVYMFDEKGNKKYFTENKDFVIKDGTLIKPKGSLLPDYTNSPFFVPGFFTHEVVATFGNDPYMVYIDYEAEVSENETVEFLAKELSEKSGYYSSLKNYFDNFKKDTLNLLVFGDSISVGGGTTDIKYAYFNRLKDYLEEKYTFKVNLINKAIGGECSRDGIKRYNDVITPDIDLMILAYGMNDQCTKPDGSQWFTTEHFDANLRVFIERALRYNIKTVLVAPILSNPKWIYSSKTFPQFIDVIYSLGKEYNLPVADVKSLWVEELKYKSYSDLLQNDINHPSNYGHYLYFLTFKNLIG